MGPNYPLEAKATALNKAISSLASFMKLTVQVVRETDGMEIIVGKACVFLPVGKGLGVQKELAPV